MSDPIIERVRVKLLDRSERGLTKYGVGLDRQDLTPIEWLKHGQEEALDLAGYLERAIENQSSLESRLKIAVEALEGIERCYAPTAGGPLSECHKALAKIRS